MKRKILLASVGFGTGHKAVSNYIEKYLREHTDYELLSIDFMDYTKSYIGPPFKKIFESMILNHPILFDLLYKAFDNNLTKVTSKITTSLSDNKDLKKVICDFNPDLTISTHYLVGDLISKYNTKGYCDTKLITIVTDYYTHEFWFQNVKMNDAIIVTSVEEKIRLALKGIPINKIKTFGIPISNSLTSKNYDSEHIKAKMKIEKRKQVCLFFGGGGLGQLTTLPFLKELIKSNVETEIIYVSGKNLELRKKAENLVKKYNAKNVHVLGYANNVPELLHIADYVITKPGGVTVTECLYMSKPMVLLKIVGGHEKGNCNYLTRKGYAKGVKNPKQLVHTSEYFEENPSELIKMSKKMKKISSNHAIKLLHNLVEKLLI